MDVVTQHFERPTHAVDCMHTLFKQWQQDGTPAHASATMLEQAELAIHEWLANLSQHADFEERTPAITLHIEYAAQRITSTIEDNSAGFDMETEMEARRNALKILPERGMGLQIIDSCAEHLSYDCVGPSKYRLALHFTAPELRD